MALINNYALKSLIHQWCQQNKITTAKSISASDLERRIGKSEFHEKSGAHISSTKTEAVKMTASFLMGKLAIGSQDIQRQAAYQLRLLAKTGMENCRMIAEAGAIPFLVTLLGSHDSRIQWDAVTALLNLSIFDKSKPLIMAAGSLVHLEI